MGAFGERRAYLVAFVVTAAVLAYAAWAQLLAPHDRVAGTSGVAPQIFVAFLPARPSAACQANQPLSPRASRLVLIAGTYGRPGPRLSIVVAGQSGVRTIGALRKGWREGRVAIPIRAESTARIYRRICIRSAGGARLALGGEPSTSPAVVHGRKQSGRISIVALVSHRETTADGIGDIADTIAHAGPRFFGGWTLYVIAALVLSGILSAALAVSRACQISGRRSAVAVAPSSYKGRCVLRSFARDKRLVVADPSTFVFGTALGFAVAWALLIPPFQVADEPAHVAYVQYLADTGHLPAFSTSSPSFSPRERAVLDAVGFSRIIGRAAEKAPDSSSQEAAIRAAERSNPHEPGNGNAETASNNPPLFYALEVPVFLATRHLGLLGQVTCMRLLSALLSAISALLAYLFVRELMPGHARAGYAGGLACAAQPVLGFVGSGVNPDSLLFACSSATLLLSAKIVRRGLTLRRAVSIALVVLAGLLTKPLFAALVPAAVVAIAVACYRAGRGSWKRSARDLSVGLAVFGLPFLAYLLAAYGPLDHPYFAIASDVAGSAVRPGGPASSVAREVSFVLQEFLPRLPFLTDFVPGAPWRDVWLNGLVGVFGWLDYQFSVRFLDAALWILGLCLLGALVSLWRARRGWKSHAALAGVCVVAIMGVCGAVGVTDYQAFQGGAARFQQARYLLPLLPLYAGFFALAFAALRRPWDSVLLVVIWGLVSYHEIAAMILTANRYYL